MEIRDYVFIIVVFTIVYFTVFTIAEFIVNRDKKKDKIKKVKKKEKPKKEEPVKVVEEVKEIKEVKEEKKVVVVDNSYKAFANFYDVDSNVSLDIISDIKDDLNKNDSINISYLSNKYNISKDEVVIVGLYLEYRGLINLREYLVKEDITQLITLESMDFIKLYKAYFDKKMSIKEILKSNNNNSIDDINYIINRSLLPGIRLVNKDIKYME